MGLDMYLTAKVFIRKDKDRYDIGVALKDFDDFKGLDIKPEYVEFEVAYWRKSNAIHQWFVDNVQRDVDNCRPHGVNMEDLKKLLAVVCVVLDDHSKAGDLLPTQNGFFFGGTDYDEWYFKDLEYTKEKLTEITTNKSYDGLEFVYCSSW